MIKVLIVEDSPTARELLEGILGSDPDIRIVGVARDGEEAVRAVETQRPDLITMDINMPGINGFETTRKIMETRPTPIVLVTASWDPRDVAISFRALEAGALTILPRPRGPGHANHEDEAKDLIQTVKLMADVKVVRRWPRSGRTPKSRPDVPLKPVASGDGVKVTAIGASTGGPMALSIILSGLPADFPAPVVVVQHIASGFLPGLIGWLSTLSPLSIEIGREGEGLKAGHVYIAPDGMHMTISRDHRIVLKEDPPENFLRPSISWLFRSIAEGYGSNGVGILLTGMGRDGADGLKRMYDAGATTIAQDEQSSIIYGMAAEAVRMDAVTRILPLDDIAPFLIRLMTTKRSRSEPESD